MKRIAALFCLFLAPFARSEWVLEFQNAADSVSIGFSYFMYDSNDALRFGTPMNIESNVTICVWLKNPTPNPQASGYGADLCDIVGTFYFGGGSGGFGFGMGKSSGTWGLDGQTRQYGGANNSPTPWFDATAIRDDGKWHHVAFVYARGVGYRFYLDGVLKSEKAVADGGCTSQNNFSLGKKNWNSFLGRMADISLFCVPLPEERIKEYAKRRILGNEANEAGLIGYWPLDDGEGSTTVADHVDLDACFAGWPTTRGKSKHNGTIGSSGPVWVQDDAFKVPTYAEWMHKQATVIFIK